MAKPRSKKRKQPRDPVTGYFLPFPKPKPTPKPKPKPTPKPTPKPSEGKKHAQRKPAAGATPAARKPTDSASAPARERGQGSGTRSKPASGARARTRALPEVGREPYPAAPAAKGARTSPAPRARRTDSAAKDVSTRRSAAAPSHALSGAERRRIITSAKTLAAHLGPTKAADLLGISTSTLARWRAGEFKSVKRSTRKLANEAKRVRQATIDYSRAHGARPVAGRSIDVVAPARRIKRRDTSKLGKVNKKTGRKNWDYNSLPLVNSDTTLHDLGGLDLAGITDLVLALRDRGAYVRLVWESPENEYYDSRTGEQVRKGGTVPTDLSDMDDVDVFDWIAETLAGGARRALYLYEQDAKKWTR